MGPRLISRGDDERRLDELSLVCASMGPRLISRGDRRAPSQGMPGMPRFNGAAADQPRRRGDDALLNGRGQASMGPRLISRGDVLMAQGRMEDLRLLQWGRG